jgi:hypothetical protein
MNSRRRSRETRASSGARWTIWQLGSPCGEDATREATLFARAALMFPAPGARGPTTGSGTPTP